jgi:MFS family permease
MSILLTMESFVKWFPEAASVIVSDDGKFVYHTGSGALTGFLFAVVPLGALVGALNHGWIADSWSRKWAIVGAATLVAAGAGVQAAAHKYATLVGGRFLGGLGIGM